MFKLILLIFFFVTVSVSVSASNSIQDWTDDQLFRVDEVAPEINRLFLFYADWCSACRRYKPSFIKSVPKLIQLSPDNLEIIQINLDKAPKLGSRFRVSHLPTVYHQIGGEFRKLDTFQSKLEEYFDKKVWIGTPSMGPLSPPRGTGPTGAPGKNSKQFTISKFVEDLGVSLPLFILLSSSILLFITLFLIWCIWLYTDYKLNSHNFTDEAIKERIKILRKLPEFEGEFDASESEFEKEDSGEESDTESDIDDEREPLRGRRIKNKLK